MADERSTVLVVDDSDTKRYVVGSWLRRAGYAVVEAASGADTWERLAEGHVDLVILDVRLPDVSGIEVCARIKNGVSTASLPVIHISALAVAGADRAYGLHSGADAYLVEPIDPEVFIATVGAVLRYYRARWRAERMAERLEALTRTTLAMNAADSFDRLAEVTAQGAAEIFGAPAAIFMLPVDGRVRRTVVLEPGTSSWSRAATPEMLSGLAALALGDLAGTDTARVSYAILHEVVPDAATSGDVSLVVSRIKSGRPPVCIVVAPPGPLDQEELNVLRQLGQSLALVMETLRSYAEEHLIALTLQRSLLPSRLPQIPGLRLAVRYEPASAQAEVGGDFYEVLRIGHRVLVAIGDVQGHSLHAATVMAEVRHALRAFVEEGHGLAQILVWLNRVMLRYHDDQTATVCLMLIDPADGSLEIANAGHPPPLLIEGDQAQYTSNGGVLIGFPGGMPSTEEATLPVGGAVILITDGLVEDRDVSLADNLERLRVLSLTMDEDLEKFSDRILAEFGHREDDVALVVLRRD